jgi:glycerophosphoryl diester phosphodiesterase
MSHPFFDGLRAPLHISHRGGAALQPENTLHAFDNAVRQWRTDLLELDIHATRDGEIVVAHDDTVDRCTDGSGPIAGFTFAELAKLDAGFRFSPDGRSFPARGLGIRIPRLVDVLRAFPRVRLNIDLKAPAALDGFVALAREEQAVSRICVGSEADDLAGALSTAMPEACLFYPRDALAAFIMPVMAGESPFDDQRFAVLDMPLYWEGVRLFTERLRDEAARLGKWINVWTVDELAQMRQVIVEGVGGVMTDRPDLLREAIG